jgi:hypothetical protein
MPFDLDTVQNLINSPPGQLIAGAMLGGIVFFEWVGGAEREHEARKNHLALRPPGVGYF